MKKENDNKKITKIIIKNLINDSSSNPVRSYRIKTKNAQQQPNSLSLYLHPLFGLLPEATEIHFLLIFPNYFLNFSVLFPPNNYYR